jgi:FAD:protein FMN transferase
MQRNTADGVARCQLRPGLGTFIAVQADADSPEAVMSAIRCAYAAIATVEAIMHPTRSGSDLLAIHHASIGASVAIHAWTWEVLALCKRLNTASNGLFDPCLPAIAGRIADLELASSHRVIAHAPMHIDLGGIAKGFAVDRALAVLQAKDCHAGLVNAGGDLAVFGHRSHDIFLRNRSGTDRVLRLANAALATSDAGRVDRPVEHRGYYHGLNRRKISAGRISVRAAHAAIADGLTKCLLADRHESGSVTPEAAALLQAFGAQLIASPEELR